MDQVWTPERRQKFSEEMKRRHAAGLYRKARSEREKKNQRQRRWRAEKKKQRESRAERAVRKAKAKSARHTTNGHHPMIMVNGESVIINGWKITPSGDQLKLEKV